MVIGNSISMVIMDPYLYIVFPQSCRGINDNSLKKPSTNKISIENHTVFKKKKKNSFIKPGRSHSLSHDTAIIESKAVILLFFMTVIIRTSMVR